jgi:nitroimidazol reductase NimA-like FMN-containing flavoprotein (pyridoxamine 5'-phosphate oxidase superfamily)
MLGRDRCLALLSSTTVGRLAFVGADGLVLLPVNYRVVAGAVVVRTSRTGTLAQLAGGGTRVVFEVDYHAPTARSGWSVLVHGTAEAVQDERALASAGMSRVVSWVPGDDSLFLAVPIEHVTGRNVG